MALTFIYCELGAHAGHYVVRNIVNGLGFAAFESGATLVACTYTLTKAVRKFGFTNYDINLSSLGSFIP